MIIKSFELTKIDLKKNSFFLFYGENTGHKKQVIDEKFKKFFKENIYFYEESEIIKNEENFFNEILSKSFFESEKLIIITRVTDKIKNIIEEILEKKIEGVIIILNAGTLEKKSKLRALFEKNKDTVCIPFYEDNNQTLSSIIIKFFRDNKIPISQQSINLIIQRCRGDRLNLKNELEKIQSFTKNKIKIDIKDIIKLTNLSENYSAGELIDSCLSKNKKKTINILNENNYSLDDCILIIRTFLIKSKRLLKLSEMEKNQGNIDAVIASFKPQIFWKDKEIVKIQVKNWSHFNLENLIFKINDTELLIKKNSSAAINILSDFIIEQTTIASN
jgi:DNA polymerase-3 subunit delta|tara:strand:+ start:298 stop:1293 length:996 start_codon:yes stop_codon:yes gene_type:complete